MAPESQDRQEASERSERPSEFAFDLQRSPEEQTNLLVQHLLSHEDNSALSADMREALSDHFQEWLLARLDSFDQNGTPGLSREDWKKAAKELQPKIDDILVRLQQAQHEQEERAQEVMEQSRLVQEKLELPEDTRFFPNNLNTPEGLRTEFIKFQARAIKSQQHVAMLSGEYARFCDRVAKVSEPAEDLLQGGPFAVLYSAFVENPRIAPLKNTQKLLARQYAAMRMKFIQQQHEMREHGKLLNHAPDALKDSFRRAIAHRSQERTDQERDLLERQEERRREESNIFEARDQLTSLLHDTRDSDMETLGQQEVLAQRQKQQAKGGKKLLSREDRLTQGISALEHALHTLPEGPQRDAVIERLAAAEQQRESLHTSTGESRERGQKLQSAELQLSDLRTQFGDAHTNLTLHIGSLDTLSSEIDDAVIALDDRILDLRADDMLDQVLLNQSELSLDLLDKDISEGVLNVEVANQQMLNTIDIQAAELANLDVAGPGALDYITHMRVLPNLGDLRFGEIPISLAGIVDGWSHIFNGIDSSIIRPLTGGTVREHFDLAKDMPVLSIFAGIGDGIGSLVSGTGMLLKNPSMMLHAIRHAIFHPTKLARAILALDDWEAGHYGYAFGKNIFEVVLLATGMHAVGAAGKAGKVAYVAARVQQGAGVARAALVASGTFLTTLGGSLVSDLSKFATNITELPSRIIRAFARLYESRGHMGVRAMEYFTQLQKHGVTVLEQSHHGSQEFLRSLANLPALVKIRLAHPSQIFADLQGMASALQHVRSLAPRARAILARTANGRTMLFNSMVMERLLARLERLEAFEEGVVRVAHKTAHRGHRAESAEHTLRQPSHDEQSPRASRNEKRNQHRT